MGGTAVGGSDHQLQSWKLGDGLKGGSAPGLSWGQWSVTHPSPGWKPSEPQPLGAEEAHALFGVTCWAPGVQPTGCLWMGSALSRAPQRGAGRRFWSDR